MFRPTWILITGPRCAGKDTAAGMIAFAYPEAVVTSIVSAVVAHGAGVLGIDQQLVDTDREYRDMCMPAIRAYEAAMRACDPAYWIKQLAWTYPQSPTVVVSDWTHPSDAAWLESRSKLIKIRVSAYADICYERGSGDAHDPAQFLLYGDTGCMEIVNNDSIADLRNQVVKMVSPQM